MTEITPTLRSLSVVDDPADAPVAPDELTVHREYRPCLGRRDAAQIGEEHREDRTADG